jgi:hypothetical protein
MGHRRLEGEAEAILDRVGGRGFRWQPLALNLGKSFRQGAERQALKRGAVGSQHAVLAAISSRCRLSTPDDAAGRAEGVDRGIVVGDGADDSNALGREERREVAIAHVAP